MCCITLLLWLNKQRFSTELRPGRNRCHHLWTNTLVLCFPVLSFPLILRGIALNISILSINPTGPLFVICPCIISIWAMSQLTCDTIINIIGIYFRQLRGIFKLILRGTAPGQLIKCEIVFYLLLQILTLGFFFEIAPSSLPLPPSSRHFSRGMWHPLMASLAIPSHLLPSVFHLPCKLHHWVLRHPFKCQLEILSVGWVFLSICMTECLLSSALSPLSNPLTNTLWIIKTLAVFWQLWNLWLSRGDECSIYLISFILSCHCNGVRRDRILLCLLFEFYGLLFLILIQLLDLALFSYSFHHQLFPFQATLFVFQILQIYVEYIIWAALHFGFEKISSDVLGQAQSPEPGPARPS